MYNFQRQDVANIPFAPFFESKINYFYYTTRKNDNEMKIIRNLKNEISEKWRELVETKENIIENAKQSNAKIFHLSSLRTTKKLKNRWK